MSEETTEIAVPDPTANIQTLDGRKVGVEKMGHLQVVSHRENFSNCVAMTFPSAIAMNDWAKDNPGVLLVSVTPLVDGGWSALATRIIGKEDYQRLLRVQAKVDQLMREEDAEQEKAQAEVEARAATKLAEERELQALGRKCRENHGAVIEENAKLKKELKKARKT